MDTGLMDIALWAGQILLAAVFLFSGSMKLTMSRARLLATGQTGIAPFPMPVVRVTAACELLAVLGLILPRLTGVAPQLTAIAAIGLCVVMAGAAISHYSLREPRNVLANIVILALCVFVAAGTLASV